MGFLDDVLGNVLGGGGQGGSNALISALIQMIQSQPGGLPGLLQKLSHSGLGDVVSSWISTGGNLPISADQLQSALGGDFIEKLAGMTGMSAGDAANGLAGALPKITDMLTPQGSIPDGDALMRGLGDLLSKLGGR